MIRGPVLASLCLVLYVLPAQAHELPAAVLKKFVAVVRDAGCSISIRELDRGPATASFAPDDVWHAISQLLSEGRARLHKGRTLILSEEECA